MSMNQSGNVELAVPVYVRKVAGQHKTTAQLMFADNCSNYLSSMESKTPAGC